MPVYTQCVGQGIEMTEHLSQLFAEARASCVEWEGAPLYGHYEITPPPEGLSVEFVSSVSAPFQGLRLNAKERAFIVNGTLVPKEVLLWHHKQPSIVQIHLKPKRGKQGTMKIWNIWRRPTLEDADIVDAWRGDSGMRVEESSDGKELLFRCTDGIGPVDFSDLVVKITRTWS